MSNLKEGILAVLLFISVNGVAQSQKFPESWLGNWKGELNWYKAGKAEPQKVNMELRIQPTDSTHQFTWQIIYGAATEDNRPYKLIAKDTAKGHWVIDENNGIVLDQFWIADKFCGAFTVQNTTIVNNYRVENGNLVVEFYSYSAKPLATTGKGNEEIPFVDSYRMNSYQKAVLQRSK